MYYQVPLRVSKQEDGLWRVEVPDLRGCFVDAPSLEDAISQIQEPIRMFLELYKKEGLPLPQGVSVIDSLPLSASIPVELKSVELSTNPKSRSKTKVAL
jgi:predicted RNase H-like HicB family nuclease